MLAQLAALEDGRIVRALSDHAPRAIRPRNVGAFTSDRRRTAALMPSEPMNRTRFVDVPPHAANDTTARSHVAISLMPNAFSVAMVFCSFSFSWLFYTYYNAGPAEDFTFAGRAAINVRDRLL